MADHARVETADEAGDDFGAHEHTYRLFVKLVKWNAVAICGLLVVLAILFV